MGNHSIKLMARKQTNSGQAMLIAVLFFLIISSTIVMGVIVPIVKQAQISTDLIKSKESYYLAEGALEDALYRMKTGKNVVSGESITVNGFTTTLSLITTPSGKTIDATSDRGGVVRKMQASVMEGVGAAFNYGVQAGTGGFILEGGSRINGNAYANGNISATGGVVITGSAIAANSSAMTTDQANNSPTPISSCTTSVCIKFRDTSGTQDFAQSFKLSTSSPLNKFRFYIKKVGSPADITVRVVNDSSDSPGTTNQLTTNGTLLASQVSTNFGWIEVVLPSNPILNVGQTYWLVLDNSTQSTSNYYYLGANTAYANGVAKVGRYSNSWSSTSPAGLDGYFEVYLGGLNSTIGGGSYVGAVVIGSAGVGDAWAHNVTGATVAGSLYCQTGANNNKACNTSRPDPAPAGFPISDANIADWKDDALVTGGWTYPGSLSVGWQGTTTETLRHINGNLTIGGGGVADFGALEVNGNVIVSGGGTLKGGPMKINGNLTIGSTGMFVEGTVYVTGNIIVSGGGFIKLASSYGSQSGVIIADGTIDISGGGAFSGSGQAGSYPLVLTTSDCPSGSTCNGKNAIEFSGGAGAVVLNAQKGTLNMSGGTGARSLAAKLIKIGGGGVITYETGLSNLNFSSGPSGGWDIQTWKEVQ